MDQTSPPTNTRNAIRASLACVQCRSRHLRCDGSKPACSRCQDDGSICNYMKSRRGGRRRAPPSAPEADAIPASGMEAPIRNGLPTPMPSSAIGSHSSRSLDSSQTSSPGSHLELWEDDGQHLSERLIGLYYRFFHGSHPLALPTKFIGAYRGCNSPGVELLVLVMQYIGSLYTSKVSSEPWREAVEVAIQNLLPNSSLFEIQALIIYAVAAQWTNYKEYSHTLINLAIDKALALGLHDAGFATRDAAKQSVYAESCRRTWWQLYTTELSMAAIDRKPVTRLNVRLVPCSVDLPCSEDEYESGIIPLPRTLADWENRELAEEPDTGFSSLTYYIGLYHTFDICVYGRPRDSEEAVKQICTRADAGVVSFRNLCSTTSRGLMGRDGHVDQFIFKSNMSIGVYTAELHRFLSTIAYNPIEAVSTCGPRPPPEKLAPAFLQEAPIHTAKILQVTEAMGDLLSLPVDLLKQSPMLACQIASPTIALIAACKYVLSGEEVMVARERIRVAISAVEKIGEVWPRAATTAKEVKIIAREIFGVSKASTTSPLLMNAEPLQQYPHSAVSAAYQGYAFLDDLLPCADSNFVGVGLESHADTVPSNEGSTDNMSLGDVTIAY